MRSIRGRSAGTRALFPMKGAILAVCFAIAFGLACGQEPQSDPQSAQQTAPPPVGLPARAPGYEIYYRSEDHTLAFATRWGYFDGWHDGRHAAELGTSKPPTEEDRYKLVPDHGLHPGISRTAYKNAYRTAYLRGFGHASEGLLGADAQPKQ